LFVLHKPKHWIDYLMICLRLIWGIGGIGGLLATEVEQSYIAIGVMGYLIYCLVPFLIYLMDKTPRYLPIVAEFVIACSLFIFLNHFFNLSELEFTNFSFFQVPALLIGYFSLGWHGCWAFIVLIIFPNLFSDGFTPLSIGQYVDTIFNICILFIIGFCFQKIVSSYQKINNMYKVIQEQNKSLELYAKQVEKLTLLEERNRLSRDLHDTVGHTFTSTIMGMDAVYYLIDASPSEAKANLKELLHITRNGLDEVRRHIHQIAPDKEEQSLLAALLQIGNEFSLYTGTKVLISTEGEEYPVSEQIRLTFIRCLQESLTNAKKHGEANQVNVELTYKEDEVRLRIEDNGKGITGELKKGFGLRAMTDRMKNINGSLEILTKKNGLILICSVPILSRKITK